MIYVRDETQSEEDEMHAVMKYAMTVFQSPGPSVETHKSFLAYMQAVHIQDPGFVTRLLLRYPLLAEHVHHSS